MTVPAVFLKHNVLRITFAVAMCALVVSCGAEYSQQNVHDSGASNPAASNDQNAPRIDATRVAKVKVLADGTILLDDKQVTVVEPKAAFAQLKEKNGVVWYYRENAADEPPQQAKSVMQAVVEARPPIKLSTKPDFSDSVGPGGN